MIIRFVSSASLDVSPCCSYDWTNPKSYVNHQCDKYERASTRRDFCIDGIILNACWINSEEVARSTEWGMFLSLDKMTTNTPTTKSSSLQIACQSCGQFLEQDPSLDTIDDQMKKSIGRLCPCSSPCYFRVCRYSFSIRYSNRWWILQRITARRSKSHSENLCWIWSYIF